MLHFRGEESRSAEGPALFTIGHSTRPIDDFVGLLKAHGVERLVDVRTVPRSRRNPQFGIETLARSLAESGVEYVHMPSLGGFRHARRDSTNTGWRNETFRGYADYMDTPEFEHALQELIVASRERRIAIMCAEAVPWRCHRSLISDALTARGVTVKHLGLGSVQDHRMTPFAKLDGMKVSYPAA
jgi:uncharacterized protein (DUF488 family)